MKEFITLVEAEVNSKEVVIKSNCTIYANERRATSYDLKDLLKRQRKVTKELRLLGTKVSNKNGPVAFIKESLEAYTEAFEDYNYNFDMMVNYGKWIISKPLPVGTSDNVEIEELCNYRNRCTAHFYSNKVMSKVEAFAQRIAELENEISTVDAGYTKVYF